MPLAIVALFFFVAFTLIGLGVAGLAVYAVFGLAWLAALAAHDLIKEVGRAANGAGRVPIILHSLLFLPLMGLNWVGWFLMLEGASTGRWSFGGVPLSFLGPVARFAYGVVGANPAVNTPLVFLKMVASGEIACAALAAAVSVFLIVLFHLWAAGAKARKVRTQGKEATTP